MKTDLCADPPWKQLNWRAGGSSNLSEEHGEAGPLNWEVSPAEEQRRTSESGGYRTIPRRGFGASTVRCVTPLPGRGTTPPRYISRTNTAIRVSPGKPVYPASALAAQQTIHLKGRSNPSALSQDQEDQDHWGYRVLPLRRGGFPQAEQLSPHWLIKTAQSDPREIILFTSAEEIKHPHFQRCST